MRQVLRRAWSRVQQVWLRRWYAAPRMKLTRLEVRLDLSTASAQARAVAEMSFRPQARSMTMVCLIGNVGVQTATWNGRPIRAEVNDPYLVLRFPKPLDPFVETSCQIRYTYVPDAYGTICQPTTREDCPEKVSITCRRPLLGLVQGHLERGTENAPYRTYEWTPPRSRRLNAIVADVRSFRKETGDGLAMWLHLHADAQERAPRILDLLIQLYAESAESNHRKLPYTDFHVVESDDRHVKPFNSGGLIVVPRGTFRTDDRPTVYGILAPELNKEWRRDPARLVATGQAD
jgi:hypothetical protein